MTVFNGTSHVFLKLIVHVFSPVSWDLSDGKSRDHLPIDMEVGCTYRQTCYLLLLRRRICYFASMMERKLGDT